MIAEASPSARRGRASAVARASAVEADDGFWQVAPGRAATCSSRPCSTALEPQPGERVARPVRRRRAVRRASSPSAVGPSGPRRRGRGRPDGRRARRGQPGGVRAGRGRGAAAVDRVLARRRRRDRSTSSCSTRRGRARKRRGGRAGRRPRARAPWRYVACDPAALARDVAIFAEHGYALERAARLRPLPDDPPRRVCRAARRVPDARLVPLDIMYLDCQEIMLRTALDDAGLRLGRRGKMGSGRHPTTTTRRRADGESGQLRCQGHAGRGRQVLRDLPARRGHRRRARRRRRCRSASRCCWRTCCAPRTAPTSPPTTSRRSPAGTRTPTRARRSSSRRRA